MNISISDNIDHFDNALGLVVNKKEEYLLYYNSHKQKVSAKAKLKTLKNDLFSKHKSKLLDSYNPMDVMKVIELYRRIIEIQFKDNIYTGDLLVKLSIINLNLCKWAHIKYYYNLTKSLLNTKHTSPAQEMNKILDGFETQLRIKGNGKYSEEHFYFLTDTLSNLAFSVFNKSEINEDWGFPHSNLVLVNVIHTDIRTYCANKHLILSNFKKLIEYKNKQIVEIDNDPISLANIHAQSQFFKQTAEEAIQEGSYPRTHTNKYEEINFKLGNARDYLQRFLTNQEDLLCKQIGQRIIEEVRSDFLMRSDFLPAEIIGMITEYVAENEFTRLVRDFMQSMPAIQPTRPRA